MFSHEALRRWFHRGGELLPRLRRRPRRSIALDESVVGVIGAENWLWNAVDLGNGEIASS